MTKKALANSLLKLVCDHIDEHRVTDYTREVLAKYNELCDNTPSLKGRLRISLSTPAKLK